MRDISTGKFNFEHRNDNSFVHKFLKRLCLKIMKAYLRLNKVNSKFSAN